MKKRWLFILAVLMIAATMFVACNSEVTDARASAQPGEELVYATFGGGSKDLTAQYSFIDYTQLYWFYQSTKGDSYGTTGAVTGNDWAKVPGDTTDGKGLDGTVGPFSQGLWSFNLRGYQNKSNTAPTSGAYIHYGDYYYYNLVYSGASTGTVSLKYGDSNAIPVTVEPAGTTGKIYLDGITYAWGNNSAATGTVTLQIKITPVEGSSWTDSKTWSYNSGYTLTDYVMNNSDPASVDIPKGTYNLDFTVCAIENNSVAYEFAKQSLSLTVFGSQTTSVKGSLEEGLFVENAHFVATDVASKIVIADSSSVSDFVVDPTPVGKSVSGKQTTVSIPAGELTSGTQNNMTIEVVSVDIAQDVATAAGFVIEDTTEETGSIAVAAIDITLNQVTTTTNPTTGDITVEEVRVKEFNNPVTITTYISPNLNSVKVCYNVPANAQPGDDVSQPVACKFEDDEYKSEDQTTAHVMTSEEAADGSTLGYYPETGLLRFQTTHFSQFFVISDAEALNETTGVYYSTLKEAFEKAEKNQTIRVYKDNVTIGEVSAYVKTGYECVDVSEKVFLVRERTICSHNRRAGTFCLDCKYPVANVTEPTFVTSVDVSNVLSSLNISSAYSIAPYRDNEGELVADSIINISDNEHFNSNIHTGVLFDFIASWEENWGSQNPNYRSNYPFIEDETLYGFDNQSNIVETQGIGITADIIFDLFRYWSVDYVCSFDEEIKEYSCSLVGYYENYGACVVIPMPKVYADEEFPLLGSAGFGDGMNYDNICNWVKEFQCGVYSSDTSNDGITFTVRLRMTKPDGWNDMVISAMCNEPFNCSSQQIYSLLPTLLNNDFVDVCTVTYTIGGTGSNSYSIR